MTSRLVLGSLAAALLAGMLPAGTIASPAAQIQRSTSNVCSSLAALTLPDTTVLRADAVSGPSFDGAGGSPLTGLPAFCRVAAVTSPAVHFEVWLPLDGWNGKFQTVGNGANAGSISYDAMAVALRRGYAAASTDTGHATRNARDASWAMGHPELVIDFGYRAIHVTTENAKKIVQAFYGTPASRSYYVGCSTGGRQGMMEAQRFPQDFDGLIAGAPAMNWTRFQTGGHLWVVLALNKDPGSYIPASKLAVLGRAVNAACDASDGAPDGILDDPRSCRFDPQVLTCTPGDDPESCFTPKQVRAVKNIWAGAHDSSGKLIYPGYLPGAEAAGGWASYMTGTGPLSGNHYNQADNVLKYMILEDPASNILQFDYDTDLPPAEAKLGTILDAFDPDLTGLRDRGAKLIMYHGWNDPSISPLNTIDYYERVTSFVQRGRTRQEAERDVSAFMRLFLVPGMLHCGGGPGPNTFDMLSALENWVERGVAPEQVVASHATSGRIDRTKPLCAYPAVAVYTGRGDRSDAASFTCRDPRRP
jgi:feruloyl esterase